MNIKPIEKWTRFWMLTTLWEQEHRSGWIFEKCICDCWNIKWTSRNHLRQWRCKSCWCLSRETSRKSMIKMNTKHWMYGTRIYKIYRWMYWRCNNKNYPHYYNYWWRGIKLLRNSFEEFYSDMWDSYNKHIEEYWEENTTIDRIDVDWNYCKENCRWSTWEEQANNRRTNTYVTYKWETMSISCLCKKYWTNYDNTLNRIISWWTIDDAIELPKLTKEYNKKSIEELRKIFWINSQKQWEEL